MKKAFWLFVLIILIPIWIVLYFVGMIGLGASFLWENFYHVVYRLAGSPLDKK